MIILVSLHFVFACRVQKIGCTIQETPESIMTRNFYGPYLATKGSPRQGSWQPTSIRVVQIPPDATFEVESPAQPGQIRQRPPTFNFTSQGHYGCTIKYDFQVVFDFHLTWMSTSPIMWIFITKGNSPPKETRAANLASSHAWGLCSQHLCT